MGNKLNKRKERRMFVFLGVLLVLLVVMAGCDTSDGPNAIIDAEDFNELAVINGTTLEEVVEELNSKSIYNSLSVTLDNGRTVTAEVVWQEEDQAYSREGPGPYTFKGTAKYEDLMKEIYIDVKVLAYFEIFNLSIEPEEITEETERINLSFNIKNMSEFACIQDIVITIESVTGDFKYDGVVIDIIEVELKGEEEKLIEREMEILSLDDLTDILASLGLTLEDINREWYVIASTNNYTDETNVTVNIQK